MRIYPRHQYRQRSQQCHPQQRSPLPQGFRIHSPHTSGTEVMGVGDEEPAVEAMEAAEETGAAEGPVNGPHMGLNRRSQ